MYELTTGVYLWIFFLRLRVYNHSIVLSVMDTNWRAKVTGKILGSCETYSYMHWWHGGRVEIQDDTIMYL